MRNVSSLFKNARIEGLPKIIRLDDLLEGIDLLMNHTIFKYVSNDHQIYGGPMGGQSSSTFADIIMKDLEVECLNSLVLNSY